MRADTRRSFWLLAIDAVFFFLTLSLAGHDNVLPLFVAGLTRSKPLIGLVPTIALGLWVVPQVALAAWVQRQPSKWRVMALTLIGRLPMIVVAAACFTPLARHPGALLALFMGLFAIYMTSDGLIVIALADMLPRLLPERERVRLFSLTQIITGVLGLAVGGLVSWALANPAWPFPRNFGLLLALACVALVISAVALLLLPRDAARSGAGAQRQAAAWGQAWGDARFRRMVLCQALTSCVWLAVPFYGVHATQRLGIPASVAGLFVVVSSLAYIAASLVLGVVAERRGLHWAIRIGCSVVISSPLLALLAEIVGLQSAPLYALVYVGIGVFNSIRMLGFRNYVFAIAPAELRPTYVGLANGIVGLTALAPVLGGALLQGAGYLPLYLLAAVSTAAGFILALRLPTASEQH